MTDIPRLLDELADGYAVAWPDQHGVPGTPWGGTRRAQPGSKPPPGSAVYIRSALVEAARLILDVHWKAGGSARPVWPGFRHQLGWRAGAYQAIHGEPNDYQAAVNDVDVWEDSEGGVRVVYRAIWHPDSADVILAAPSPEQFRSACHATAARVEAVHDPDILHVLEFTAQWARSAVRRAGGDPEGARRWQRINFEHCGYPLKAGALCGAQIEVKGRCKRHYDAERYQERKERKERQQAASS